MNIRRAQNRDIPGMIALLYQVGGVHHHIRPDIFCSGALKYDESALKMLLLDETKPIFVADDDGFVAGYCFCQIRSYCGSTVLTDRKELYIDDLCVDENRRGQHIGTILYDLARCPILFGNLNAQFDPLTGYCIGDKHGAAIHMGDALSFGGVVGDGCFVNLILDQHSLVSIMIFRGVKPACS